MFSASSHRVRVSAAGFLREQRGARARTHTNTHWCCLWYFLVLSWVWVTLTTGNVTLMCQQIHRHPHRGCLKLFLLLDDVEICAVEFRRFKANQYNLGHPDIDGSKSVVITGTHHSNKNFYAEISSDWISYYICKQIGNNTNW